MEFFVAKSELLIDLVRGRMLSVSDVAAKVKLSEEEFFGKMQEYREKSVNSTLFSR